MTEFEILYSLTSNTGWDCALKSIQNLQFLQLQGYETTAITISNVLVMLALHQEYQETMYQEIRALCPNDTHVTPEDLNQLHFTNRFVKETMRLLPTVPLIARQAKADFYVGEKIICVTIT